MKAIAYHRYGSPDVLKCEEVSKPAPGDDEVLIRVRAASVNPVDRHYRGSPYLARLMTGLRRPKDTRLGYDVAGEVEAVGAKVSRFKPGDPVFGVCRGAFAEYGCAAETALVMKPDNVTFEQAASVPVAGLTALQGLRDKGKLQPGQQVLINGAAGGVGTFAVQVAKSFGAEVTGVCSTRNVEMVRSIGADRVIDYTREDFTKGTPRYDLIFDCISNHSLSAIRRVLNPRGKCVIAGGLSKVRVILTVALKALLLSWVVSQKFGMFVARRKPEDLAVLGDLLRAGKIMPVIDRRYRLSEVPEAMRYLDEGHARGKIIITVEQDD
ncbi:MAG TPA: NAD(P)-dependent alcohol dehydrogenase [Blastocatellia bacterium]|nr:NAD(P)-dependent alcohol dehydrogenase [Blastocatellia bacterium]